MRAVAGRPRVLLVGPRESSFIGREAVDADVVMLQSADRLTPAQLAGVQDHRIVDLDDPDACLAAAAQLHRASALTGVAAMHERYLLVASRIAHRLGLAGNPESAVRAALDKASTRRAAEGTGLLNPRYRIAGPDELAETVAEIGFPCVVKPIDGAGSIGVNVLRRPADLDALERDGSALLVEEYVEGPEYSIESFSRDGVHRVLAITEKSTTGPHCVEVAHRMPAPGLGPDTTAGIVDAVPRLLDAIGHRVGPAHTEVRLSGGRPYLIETHTRYGGDRIWELTGLTTGRYPQPSTIAALAGVPDPARPAEAKAAAVRFVTAAPGVVARVSGLDEAARVPGVVRVEVGCAPGDLVGPLRSSLDRLGFVVAVGDDAHAASRTCAQAVARIEVAVR